MLGILIAACSSTVISRRADLTTCVPGETEQCMNDGCVGSRACGSDRHFGECACKIAQARVPPSDAGSSGGVSTGGASALGGSPVFGGAGGSGNVGQPVAPPDAGCYAVDIISEPIVRDMYVMYDQSSSMSSAVPNSNPPITWWFAAEQGMADFLQNPAAAGTGVGIQYFPYKGSIAGPDPGVPSSSCYVQNYATPEVEIAPLPAVAKAVETSLAGHAPTTFTPTAAALEGAIQHMKKWGASHPGPQPVVVLVTDGFPTECDPQDPSLVAQIALQGAQGTPSVRTFVIGLEDGGGLDSLSQIAHAGGTDTAFLIQGGDVAQGVAQAMLRIASSAVPCEHPVPGYATSGAPVNPDSLWIEFISTTGAPTPLPRLDDAGQCQSAADGWYFDSPTAPSKFVLCPQTCTKQADNSLRVKLGCVTTPPMH